MHIISIEQLSWFSEVIYWVFYVWQNWGISFGGYVIPFYYILAGCFLLVCVIWALKWMSGADFFKIVGLFFGG